MNTDIKNNVQWHILFCAYNLTMKVQSAIIAFIKKMLTKIILENIDRERNNMSREEVLSKICKSYQAYYDLNEETPEEPFAAEASFHSHDDAFFIVHAAVIGESESNEYVFFADEESLSKEKLEELDKTAWEKGISRVKPHEHHRNTDITLIIVADVVSDEAIKLTKSIKHYKNYRMSLHGFSHYRLAVVDLANKKVYCNRIGRAVKKNVEKIVSKVY